jgi:hypothetical protein
MERSRGRKGEDCRGRHGRGEAELQRGIGFLLLVPMERVLLRSREKS